MVIGVRLTIVGTTVCKKAFQTVNQHDVISIGWKEYLGNLREWVKALVSVGNDDR